MENLKTKIKRLLKEYEIAIGFATNKDDRRKSMVSEMEVKDQFIKNVERYVEKEDAKCKMISDTLEAVEKAINPTFSNIKYDWYIKAKGIKKPISEPISFDKAKFITMHKIFVWGDNHTLYFDKDTEVILNDVKLNRVFKKGEILEIQFGTPYLKHVVK